MSDISRLTEKLIRIEALFAGAATEGERVAAAEARTRIMKLLQALVAAEPPIEFRWTLPDVWSRKLLLALLRRYDLKPYRFRGQRHTTVMVRAPKKFVQETLLPEFQQLNAELRRYLDEVTERVVADAVHCDSSDAAEVEAPRQLGGAGRG
ncbi:MAG: hypothetical protein HY906_18140 [Deltaproteobacteria bacterium]|nr:hypothetical protein [Deltaproteobacteria bacterium]